MVEIDFDELDNIEFNTFNDQDKKANFLNLYLIKYFFVIISK